jgi:hypothetical protein
MSTVEFGVVLQERGELWWAPVADGRDSCS